MSVKAIARLGDWVPKDDVRAVNRTGGALVAGDLVVLDLTGSDGDVNTWALQKAATSPEGTASPLANVIKVATAHLTGWVFLVAKEAIADNAIGKFCLRGITGLNVTSGAVVLGDKLMGANAATTALKTTDGEATVALALEANGSAAAKIDVLFDGWALNPAGSAS